MTTEIEQRARELREQGMTYAEIGKILGVLPGKARTMCNRERARQNTTESNQRYQARNRTPLWQEGAQ